MNIKHKYLENIRYSPQDVVSIVGPNNVMGKTMIRGWDLSISTYHQEGINPAINYIQEYCSGFNDNNRNRQKTESLIQNLIAYDENYTQLNYEFVNSLARIKIDVAHNNYLTGEILRIDRTQDGGYAITLMQRENEVWVNELRFPVIQRYYSNKFNCPWDMVKVGVYNFETMEHEYVTFDEETLRNAWDEVRELSNQINNFIL